MRRVPHAPDNRGYGRNHSSQSDVRSRGRTIRESLSETAQSAGDYVSDVGGRVAESASDYANFSYELC